MTQRQYTLLDRFIGEFDAKLQTVFGQHQASRPYPAESVSDDLSARQQKQSACLMRVNHTGEVCAQALYRGQALTAKSSETKRMLHEACQEEVDHLAWCHQRLQELNSHRSYLNPIFYSGSFALGVVAGVCGDARSMGFVEETENQVEAHLKSHLDRLPKNDFASRAIVQQMKEDEAQHAQSAKKHGAKALPKPVKKIMQLMSAVMTRTTHWV